VRERRLRAIAIMIAAVAIFSFMDALLKLLAAYYPPMQVAALRGATSLPFTLLPVLLRRRLQDLRPRRWPMHLLRGVLSVLVLGGFIYAVRVLSLANAYAVFLSAPLIVAALSVPLLGERIDGRNWLAIAVRVMTRSDTTVSVVFWTVGLMTVFTTAISAPGWVPIEHAHWKWLLGLGLLAAVAQYLLTEAFRSAPPSVVTPFEYTALLWGVAIDRVVWHVLPSARVCIGGGLVIATGLYLIWHQRRLTGSESPRETWQPAAEKGRMLRHSSTVEVVARKQEEDSP